MSHRHAVSRTIPWAGLLQEARQRFGIKRFRSAQREVLESVFNGRSTIAIMPTGAGKSLTYQLPALFLSRPVVVVSPLIALMQDQQDKAERAEIAVEKIDSTLSTSEATAIADLIAQGIPQLIYVTPERLENREFVASLAESGVALFVVDEAHCIAQWGHDFRPAYLNLGYARKALGNPPVLALTGTATAEIVKEIRSLLEVADATIVNAGTERENIFFSVYPTVNTDAKLARIASMIAQEEGTGIIYTASVRSANELYQWLTERGISVGHYHGRMRARDRERVQQDFMGGEHKVMIATKAFGLGIDKPDIRFVYHYEFPDSLETYAQEAGRAGRDGAHAHAALLYRLEDKRIQSFFLAGRYPKLPELRAVLEVLASHSRQDQSPASALHIAAESGVGRRRTQVILHLLRQAALVRRGRRGYVLKSAQPPTDQALATLLETYVERAQNDKERLAEMMHYAEAVQCRTQILRSYFGEPEGEACQHCDNCRRAAAQSSDRPTQTPAHIPAQPTVIIETMHGTIATTAPETLPIPESPLPFSAGDQVHHRRFGIGKVLDIHQDNVLVEFERAGQKRLRADFLRPAA
jgi:ATP-dependent DNA helicase RecQ